MSNHGRRLRRLGRPKGGDWQKELTAILQEIARRDDAVRALVAFALHLAGTDKWPSQVPTGGGNAQRHVPAPPPSLPPPTKGRVWTMDIRPGPHDLLTWEEAMQVPWYNPLPEPER